MTLEELLAESPELYLAILEEGRAQERNRALSHLDTARYYDAVAEAVEAVRSGTPAEDEAELNDVYAEIQDTRDALDEAVETKRPPQVVEAKAHRYEQAAKRLAG